MNTFLLVTLVIVALYIAYRVTAKGKPVAAVPSPASATELEIAVAGTAAVKAEEFTEIALQDPSGNNVVTMSRIGETLQGGAGHQQVRPLDTKSTGVSRLAPILGALPGLGQSAMANGKDMMQVIVNGSLHPGKIADTLSPVVRNTKGQITEWAVLKDPKSLQNAAKLTAVFQVASVIVAQQHLADITEKLKSIEKGIEEIKSFLETQRSAIITGSLTYLRQAHSAISAGELSPLFREQLETLELDLLRVQEHIVEEIRILKEKTADIQNPDTFGTEGFFDAITAHQAQIDKSFNAWLLCTQTRIANWQVLSVYPGELAIKLVRKKSIEEAMEKMLAQGGMRDQLSGELNAKISDINSRVNSAETLKLRKSSAKNNFDEISRGFTAQGRQIHRDLTATTQSLLSYESNPLTLNLLFDNGKIVEAFEVIPDSQSRTPPASRSNALFPPDLADSGSDTSALPQQQRLHPNPEWPFPTEK